MSGDEPEDPAKIIDSLVWARGWEDMLEQLSYVMRKDYPQHENFIAKHIWSLQSIVSPGATPVDVTDEYVRELRGG